MHRDFSTVVGRDSEARRLRQLLDAAGTVGEGLVLVGDAGLGKSTLLDCAATYATENGWNVLRCRGGRSEADLAFAGLHQLLHGVLDRCDELPPGQATALRTALGLEYENDAPTPLRVGVALLSLLSLLATDQPLLLVVDDCQWVDSATLDALAFAVRRASEEPIALLAGARGALPPRSLAPLPRLVLEPLDLRQSGKLLDALEGSPRGAGRTSVLRQAAGNPLALTELARALQASPSARLLWETGPLPLTDRLYEVYGASLAELPTATRRALLTAAVADTGDGSILGLATSTIPPEAWSPAEDAGLVTTEGVVRFRHPLVRAAVYRAAAASERRAAHQVVAELLADYPDRRAWHLAATALGPDEYVAGQLEASAEQSTRRGAYAEAARALERAAELSTHDERRAGRLAAAADQALLAGDVPWVSELVSRVQEGTEDPALLRLTATIRARALASTLDHDAAESALRHSFELWLPEEPFMAMATLTTAALVVQFTGRLDFRKEILGWIEQLEEPLANAPAEAQQFAASAMLWIKTAVNLVDERDELVDELQGRLREQVTDTQEAMLLGAAGMILDETEAGVRLLSAAADTGRQGHDGYVSAATLTGLAWACVERGRWDEAVATANEGHQIAVIGRQEMFTANAAAVEGTVAALRGEVSQARSIIAGALKTLDPDATTGIMARLRQASAFAAQAAGDHALAFQELSRLFQDDGVPTHYQRSWYGLADLTASGIRAGMAEQARDVVDRALAHLKGPLRPRLRLQVDRARALLATNDRAAEKHFRDAVAGTGLAVPFELAQARLDYGEWLRRRRRVIEARLMLELAREEFERLGAGPWIERTMAELRASGIKQDERAPDAFGRLTPQQQHIARLAATGLTNREIAERLFLSPRTVSTHLHAIFPTLQITSRAQLHQVVPAEL